MKLNEKMDPDMSDLELIAAYKATGNPKYLEALFKRHIPLVAGACMKFLKDRNKAEEATIDICFQLHTKLLTHDVKNFKSWLYMLTRTHCMALLKKGI